MIDHNEASQSIRSLDEADLVEVIDHHRIGAQTTTSAIPFTIDCVGSTATLISERIIASGLIPPKEITALLLAGVIADTLILASPTTTGRDRAIADKLMKRVCEGDTFPYSTLKAFGEALFSSSSSLSVLSVDNIINGDLKEYKNGAIKFGIAQIEVGNLVELGSRIGDITRGLEKLCSAKECEFAVLMATDVVRSTSRLVLAGNTGLLNDLPYVHLADGTIEATGVVSRKKQLLPAVLGLLEAI